MATRATSRKTFKEPDMELNKKNLPETDTLVQNIIEVYNTASPADVVEGTNWYVEANNFCKDLAAGTQYSVETIAAVVSAISPRMPWGRNKTVAREIVRRVNEDEELDGLGLTKNVNLAGDILKGKYLPHEVLKNKRLAFWRNICLDFVPVTVDAHAVRLATHLKVDSPGRYYQYVETAYQLAADRVGIAPALLQAITWVAYRRATLTAKQHSSFERV